MTWQFQHPYAGAKRAPAVLRGASAEEEADQVEQHLEKLRRLPRRVATPLDPGHAPLAKSCRDPAPCDSTPQEVIRYLFQRVKSLEPSWAGPVGRRSRPEDSPPITERLGRYRPALPAG